MIFHAVLESISGCNSESKRPWLLKINPETMVELSVRADIFCLFLFVCLFFLPFFPYEAGPQTCIPPDSVYQMPGLQVIPLYSAVCILDMSKPMGLILAPLQREIKKYWVVPFSKSWKNKNVVILSRNLCIWKP